MTNYNPKQNIETQVNQPIENPRMGNVKKSLIAGLWGAAITATALTIAGAGMIYNNAYRPEDNTPKAGYKVFTTTDGERVYIPINVTEVDDSGYKDPETNKKVHFVSPKRIIKYIPFRSSSN